MARILTGVVSSDKNDKTIVITMTERRTHPLYKKQYTVNTKFMAHDDKNEAKLGDQVSIIETRPKSARKRFELHSIIQKVGAHFEESDATLDVPEDEIMKKEKPVLKPAAKEAKTAGVAKESDK